MAKKKTAAAAPKPRNDAYVTMLFITLVAIVTGCVLMYIDNEEYVGAMPPQTPTKLEIPKLGGVLPGAGAGATPAPAAPVPEPMPAPAP